ncbi:unnamed protein product [Owenia fusiformis]|uniref:Uncharacterized protein n=1 Tax=Owenia fusiformis TaxID=6347 RepID=A0A8J1TEV5_OWEFU|nr:unnamed protein product [Owenia fusiformis]
MTSQVRFASLLSGLIVALVLDGTSASYDTVTAEASCMRDAFDSTKFYFDVYVFHDNNAISRVIGGSISGGSSQGSFNITHLSDTCEWTTSEGIKSGETGLVNVSTDVSDRMIIRTEFIIDEGLVGKCGETLGEKPYVVFGLLIQKYVDILTSKSDSLFITAQCNIETAIGSVISTSLSPTSFSGIDSKEAFQVDLDLEISILKKVDPTGAYTLDNYVDSTSNGVTLSVGDDIRISVHAKDYSESSCLSIFDDLVVTGDLNVDSCNRLITSSESKTHATIDECINDQVCIASSPSEFPPSDFSDRIASSVNLVEYNSQTQLCKKYVCSNTIIGNEFGPKFEGAGTAEISYKYIPQPVGPSGLMVVGVEVSPTEDFEEAISLYEQKSMFGLTIGSCYNYEKDLIDYGSSGSGSGEFPGESFGRGGWYTAQMYPLKHHEISDQLTLFKFVDSDDLYIRAKVQSCYSKTSAGNDIVEYHVCAQAFMACGDIVRKKRDITTGIVKRNITTTPTIRIDLANGNVIRIGNDRVTEKTESQGIWTEQMEFLIMLVGIIALVLLCLGLMVFICCRRRKQQKQDTKEDEVKTVYVS